jgi:hypothetical protein
MPTRVARDRARWLSSCADEISTLEVEDIELAGGARASARVLAERTEHEKRGAQVEAQKGKSPSQLIDERISELGDWRGELLSRLRALVKQADPEVIEEWKWRGTPVWSHDGLICTGETYKNVVKMTFAKGASLKDPSRLFNSSLEGNTRRAIDFHEGESVDEESLKALIRAAVTLNTSSARR